MFAFLLTLLILDALLLSVVVLLQAGQGGGLASLGGGTTDTVLGGRQAVTILTKATWWCGGIFLVLALVLSLVPRGGGPSELQERLRASSARAAPSAPLPLGGTPPRRRRRAPAAAGANGARRPGDTAPAAEGAGAPGGQPAPAPAPATGSPGGSHPAEEVTADRPRGDRMTDRPAFVLLEDGAWFRRNHRAPASIRPSVKWSSPPISPAIRRRSPTRATSARS